MAQVDIWLMRKITVITISAHKCFGICIVKHKARATFRMWRFLRFSMSFYCGVYVYVV